MHLKWYFRNDPTSDFSEKLSFTPISSWKLPTGDPNLGVFLSELEKQMFKIIDSKLGYSSFSKEECLCELWLTIGVLLYKKADKDSAVVV